jgi:predicted NUDIX family NTP pyrophosphohydrolase
LDEKYMEHYLRDGIEAFKWVMTSKKACVSSVLKKLAAQLEMITSAVKPPYLWHGSRDKIIGSLEPRQAVDIGGAKGSNKKAVYATSNRDFAISMGMAERDAETFIDWSKTPRQLVVVKGKIRHGQHLYLYKLPSDTFRHESSGGDEWTSMEPVTPIGVETLLVDKYLHLVREKPTEEDIKFYISHGGKLAAQLSKDKVFDPNDYTPEWVAKMKAEYPGEPSVSGVYKKEDLYRDQKGIAAVIKDDSGKILVQKHVKFGFWTIPVGKCKEGQSQEEALKEELLEETGITVKSYKKIGHMPQHYIRWGFPVDIDVAIYEVTAYNGDPSNKEPEKHTQQLFMDVDELKSTGNMSDSTHYVLNLISKQSKPQKH